MNTTILQYKNLLQRKLDILESIHKNTIAQSQVLESKNDVLLGKLLKECEEHIKSFTQLMSLSETTVQEKDDEAVRKEHAIDSLFREIVSINSDNAKKVEELKNNIADNIKHLKISRNFVRSSGGLNLSQQFGYFIDKKA